VAVLIDLVTSPDFDTAAPDPKADSQPHNLWERDQNSVVLVPGSSNQSPAISRATRPISSSRLDGLSRRSRHSGLDVGALNQLSCSIGEPAFPPDLAAPKPRRAPEVVSVIQTPNRLPPAQKRVATSSSPVTPDGWEQRSHQQPRAAPRAWRGWRAPDLPRSEHRGHARPHPGFGSPPTTTSMICPLDRWITPWATPPRSVLDGPDPGILPFGESLCSPEVPGITSYFSVGVVSVNTL
jgi:hypothetical protein